MNAPQQTPAERFRIIFESLSDSDVDSSELQETLAASATIRPELDAIAELARLASEISEPPLKSYATT